MTSQLNVDTIVDKAGTGPVGLTKQEAAKARFVSDSNMAFYGSFNIASGTDNGTGNYTYAFTNVMANALYCGPNSVQSSGDRFATINSLATANFVVNIFNADQGINQNGSPHQVIFGDLA
jgi:hypothetical protein